MPRTLNYTVQRVLEKLNLDPVNSINDTEDSLLVSREAESTFYDMMSRADWPDKIDLVRLTSSASLSRPTELTLEEEVYFIRDLRYDITTPNDDGKRIREVRWVEPEDFLRKVHSRNTQANNVVEVMYKTTPIFIIDNAMPTFYTSFDNKTLVLDSYDKSVEDSLQGSKAICYAKVVPNWVQEDDFVIPVQDNYYPVYLAALASACALYLNMQVNQEDERRQMRGISRMRRESVKTELETFPRFRYGRNGNGLS